MELETLTKPDAYQVFLFICPANLPFSFAVHPWLVVNKTGALSRFGVGRDAVGTRWEVLFEAKQNHTSWGHLHKNLLPPSQGIAVFSFSDKFFWKGKLLGYVEGGEGSVAHRMAEFVNSSHEVYPYNKVYSLCGPNSNTYVQWVLNRFPASGLKLPWNAFGKNYARQ